MGKQSKERSFRDHELSGLNDEWRSAPATRGWGVWSSVPSGWRVGTAPRGSWCGRPPIWAMGALHTRVTHLLWVETGAIPSSHCFPSAREQQHLLHTRLPSFPRWGTRKREKERGHTQAVGHKLSQPGADLKQGPSCDQAPVQCSAQARLMPGLRQRGHLAQGSHDSAATAAAPLLAELVYAPMYRFTGGRP